MTMRITINPLATQGAASADPFEAAFGPAPTAPTAQPSRAVRNNSPGNLRPGSNADGSPRMIWQGQTGVDDGGYAQFTDPDAGKEAVRQQVLHDYNHNGLTSPLALATKYAPPSENNTAHYAGRIAASMGIKPTDDAGLNDPAKLHAYTSQLFANEDASAAPAAADQNDPFEAAFGSATAAVRGTPSGTPDNSGSGVAPSGAVAGGPPAGTQPNAPPAQQGMAGTPAVPPTPQGAGQLRPGSVAPPSFGTRMLRGVEDVTDTGLQWGASGVDYLAHKLGAGDKYVAGVGNLRDIVDAGVKSNEGRYQAGRGADAGFDGARAAGEVAGTLGLPLGGLSRIAPGAALAVNAGRGARFAGAVGDAALQGAAGAALTTSAGGTTAHNAGLGAALGAGIGIVSPLAGRAVSGLAGAVRGSIPKAAAAAAPMAAPDIANAVASGGARRGLISNTDIPTTIRTHVHDLAAQGVPVDQALREAEAAHIGARPTVADVNRNFADQQATREGAKMATPEGQALMERQTANNAAAHSAVSGLIDGYGGIPAPGGAITTARKALADASDAARAVVKNKYGVADAESASAQAASDARTATAQTAANDVVSAKAQAAARAKFDVAQDAYRQAKTTTGANVDSVRTSLLKARAQLSAIAAKPPTAAKIAPDAPGYINLSALRAHLDTPEMMNPTTEGLKSLGSGLRGYLDALGGKSGKVTASAAESVRQSIGDAYDPLGGSINHHVGNMKGMVDAALDAVESNAPASYKAARAAHREWAQQYDVPGVADLIKRDASGAFVKSSNILDRGIVGGLDERPFANVVSRLKAIGDTASIDKLKASTLQDAYDATTRTAHDAGGHPNLNGRVFLQRLDGIGSDKLSALFSKDELGNIAAIGRGAMHVNEAVPGAVNNSSTKSALANALNDAIAASKKTAATGGHSVRDITQHAGALAMGVMSGHEALTVGASLAASGAAKVAGMRSASKATSGLVAALRQAGDPATMRAAEALRAAKLAAAVRGTRAANDFARIAGPAAAATGSNRK